jgi:hypothetical protein
MAKNQIERRTLGTELRAEKSGEDLYQIRGYAATFNSPSKDLGGFREVVAKGAFKRALKEKQDVKALFNHSADRVLGRVGNGTLELAEDERGLSFRCQLNPAVTWHRDLWQSVQRGDISECSFAFKAPESGQKWGTMKDERGVTCAMRTLTDVDLFDVSAVTYPAYNTTSLEAREARSFDYVLRQDLADMELAAIRAKVRAIGAKVLADRQAKTEDVTMLAKIEALGNEVRNDRERNLRERVQKALLGFDDED